MGNKLFAATIRRPIKNWNIENRANKVIDLPKPKIAPRHQTTVDKLKEFEKEHPELLEAQKIKDEKLNSMLKGAAVGAGKMEIKSRTRPLPQSRSIVDDPEFGFLEPAIIPEGRCSLRQSLEFINGHCMQPEEYTAEKIASQYKLPHGQVQVVLRHFNMLWVQTPVDKKTRKLLEQEGKVVGMSKREKFLDSVFPAGLKLPKGTSSNELGDDKVGKSLETKDKKLSDSSDKGSSS